MRKFHLILFLGFFFVFLADSTTVKDFTGGAFTIKPRDGLYLIDIGMENLQNGGNLISSFADFNGDKYTDLVTLTNDNLTIHVYLWSDDDGFFHPYTNLTLDQPIVSIISADFDDNGDSDLLITTESKDSESNYDLYFFKQNKANSIFEEKAKMQISKNHPFIVDLDGNHKVEVFYLDPLSFERKIARFNADNASFEEDLFENYVSTASGCISYSEISSYKFPNVHYNSFVDLNGDCRADLFITSTDNTLTFLEIWIKQSDGTFCLVSYNQTETSSVKGITFADFDFDGGIDMIVATEDAEALWFEIFYNSLGIGTDNMCAINTNNQKNNPFSNASSSYFKYKATENLNSNLRLFSLNSNFPSALRVGDIDADTYPDLLLTLYDSSKTSSSPKTYLFKNQECSQEFCQNAQHKRYFRYGENSFNSILDQTNNTLLAAFMDIGEMGSLDIILASYDENSSFIVKAIFNYLNPDTFFLKALGLNGFSSGSTGGIYYGSTFQCVITTLDGDQKVSNNIQLFQSSHNALQLPYAFIGLGRTNNYVENFYIGMPQNSTHSKSWTPIIPNSQLIVYPTTENPDNWTIDIYVNPTKATIIVVISTASILLIIGIVILYLHKKEKEEDKTYQEQFQQFFR